MNEAANWRRPRCSYSHSMCVERPESGKLRIATLLNLPFTAVPMFCTAKMIAIEILAAMRPYSMAVAPKLSL